MRIVLFINGLVVLFVAGLMLIVALLFAETRSLFAETATLVGLVGGGVALVVSGADTSTFSRSDTFLVTASVWVSASLAGAVPLYVWGLSPVDAIFESFSAATTTGSTVMSGLDMTARGILM